MKERIVVDIDNTLWDFAPELYERVRKINPGMPPPSAWSTWDFWRPYVAPRTLYEVIRGIHMEQEKFIPYGESQHFLTALREAGFYIVIASHRENGTMGATQGWLDRHTLPYDEIHLSHDKTVLFDDCWAVVDDSPVTLDKARQAGIVQTGLLFPWNDGLGHPVFSDLPAVMGYLRSQCRR